MRLISIINVEQTVEQTWEFLSNPLNSNKWDKSIDHVILPKDGKIGQGCKLDTVAPSGMKQSFIITEYKPPQFFKFVLLKSSMFKAADLSFLIERVNNETRITHEINFKLHFRSLFLYPIFLFTSKKALGTDLEYLKKALIDYFKNNNLDTAHDK